MYKIGDFSKITDLPIKTLRYYDEINLLKPANIDTFTSYRYYTDSQIDDAKLIIKLKELDLSLDDIKNYINTKNINVIKNKKEDLDKIITSITEFINNKYNEYIIKEYDYNKYVEINGVKYSKTPQALEVKDKNAKYYVIYNNDIFVDDFVIFINNDNWLTLNIMKYLDSNYIKYILNYLNKTGYSYVTTYIPVEERDIMLSMDKNLDIISKEVKTQAHFQYIKYKINLK